MKTCSKCNRELPETEFVKAKAYKDGLYPSCKQCKKAVILRWLDNNPLCSKCKTRPHRPGHGWCAECEHAVTFKDHDPKFIRSTPRNDGLCARCHERPKLSYHSYCAECKNASRRDWAKNHGGHWQALTPEQKRKATVRAYINNKVHTGKMQRKPCEVCGEPSEFHHLDYNDRTLNVRNLCPKHHDEEERRLTADGNKV